MVDELAETDLITSRHISKLTALSQTASYRILVELEGKWKRLKKEAHLTESGMKRRVIMAKKLISMKDIWGTDFHRNVIWTDER